MILKHRPDRATATIQPDLVLFQEFPLVPSFVHAHRAVLALIAVLLLSAGPANAHAILEDSTPPARGKVPSGRVVLSLRYNSRGDAARSRLTLIRPDHTRVDLPLDPGGPPDHLGAAVTLTPGAYTVRWQVLAIDGHITRGDLPFTVTEP